MSAPHELEVLPDAPAACRRGADLIARAAREAVRAAGRFTLAVSGGTTPLPMFAALGEAGLPWGEIEVWQADERVAPAGHRDRDLTGQLASLPPSVRLHPMPVEERDLEAAAARYAAGLPPAFDLVHLGLGDDGHTASLVPGDAVLEVADRDVALTGEYRGRRRMTLTYPVLERAGALLWLVTGSGKRETLDLLLRGDPSIPAGRVRGRRSVVIADRAAAGER